MKLIDKLSDGFKYINKVMWIILIPIIFDVSELLIYQHVFQTKYIPRINLFTFKIGFPSPPPSIRFVLQDFPSVILQYKNNVFNGIVNEFTIFNVLLIITVTLIISYIKSSYLRVISKEINKPVGLKDLFELDNTLWVKFLVLQIIMFLPFALMFIREEFLFLAVINIILIYVQYSFVVDGGSILSDFKKGVAFLFNNLGLTIKMSFYFGAMFSLLSIAIFILSGMGLIGIIINIVIVAYFGAATNKAVLEIYRELSKEID